MDYYTPPPPDPDTAQYQQYQYTNGFPPQHFHPAPIAPFDHHSTTEEEHYTNFDTDTDTTTTTNTGVEVGVVSNNFNVDSPPTIPMESRGGGVAQQSQQQLHNHRHNHHLATTPQNNAQGTSLSSSSPSEALPEEELRCNIQMKVNTVFKKAPGAPKRFKSSYVHFFTHFVEKKKLQVGPDGLPIKLDISSVSKECSQAWKTLPVEQRKYWDFVSEQEKQEYMKQSEAYQGPWRIATNKVKKKKDGAPKRSPSAFFLFANVKRPVIKAKYPDMPNREVVKACSEMWKNISNSEKGPFLEEERKLRAQYHIEAESWKKQIIVREQQQQQEEEEEEERGEDEKKAGKSGIVGGGGGTRAAAATTTTTTSGGVERLPPEQLTIPQSGHNAYMNPPGYAPPFVKAPAATNRGKKRKRDPNAPKRSPPAFFLFVNHCRPELKMQYPELRHTELVKMLGQKWSQMSEEEKRPFRDHEEQLRQQYHIDIKHYKKRAVPEQEYTNLGSLHVAVMKPQQQHVVGVDNREDKMSVPPSGMHTMHREVDYHQQPGVQNHEPHYQQSLKEGENELLLL